MRNEASRAARRPILIIESDRDVRKSLHLLLETRGHDVEAVGTTREAFVKLRAGIDPCLILFDLGMLYEGREHGRRGQLERGFGRVPVIAYTADAQLRKDLKTRLRSGNPAASLSRLCELAARHCVSAEASGPPAHSVRRESRRVDPSAGRGLKAPRSRAKGARHDVAAGRRKNQPA